MKFKILMVTLAAIAIPTMAARVSVETRNMSLVLDVENGQPAKYLYFGHRINSHDLPVLAEAANGRMDAYPAYGMNTPYESALALRHADGSLSTQLVATGQEVSEEANATLTTVHLKDRVYALEVDLKYRAYKDVDMIEAWTEITNGEKGKVTLTNFASMTLPVRRGNVYATHFYGGLGQRGASG